MKVKRTHAFAVRLGRLAGVDVFVDLSALVIAGLLALALATSLPNVAAGYRDAEYVAVGIIAALLFLAALLAHELSHAAVARARGIAVRDVVLWLLGGIATLEGEPKDARDALAVAIVGPATSGVLALTFLLLAGAAHVVGVSPLLVAASAWLGSVNLVLALFNLVPAAPLDGGRVLMAAIWQRSGDRLRAVRAAARAGEYFAWFLFGLGVVELLVGFGISGLWAMVLGWFILGAARAEGARAVLDEGLAGMRIGELMTPHPITVPDTITADELLECVRVHRCTSFPLTHDHEITGLATLARCRAVDPRRRAGVMVRDVAWPIERVTVARPDELAADVLRRVSGGDGRILVLEHGHLRGIVSPSDVTRAVSAATG